jgi:Aerotolerance regulator N-terminal/von Willebrand factor type A domain
MGSITFTTWSFAAAGALCALGPVMIHLLNRRRYRVVQWGAMEFLRQAMQQNRRIMRIRDLVLLTLRTLAVLLFGLALARPYLAHRVETFDARQPLHAVIVIDNSLSMAYQSLDGSLLDRAKEAARQLIAQVPAGSRFSILAACGSRQTVSSDPYDTKDNALEAIQKIETVDRSLSIVTAASAIGRACEAAPELAKRVVFITDQQALNWRDSRQSDALADVPPLQIVSVAPSEWENTWIADVRIQDGLADVETPATVIVELAHRGPGPRRDLQVTLSLGETIIGQKTVTVEPGPGTREVDFECVFSGLVELPEPDRPVFVSLRATISPDRLAADDERVLTVPVVAALSVVFIDQYGPDNEDIARGRVGETRHLRRLLAPKTSQADAPRQLVSVRHVTPEQVQREHLADARLVVVAGLRDPGEMTPLLADYVRQGGQLVLAAGAEFDPAAWNDAAWLAGEGILPLPLQAQPLGQTPDETTGELKPFFLSIDSVIGEDYFQLAGVGEAELKDLYAEPFFFKAALVDVSPPVLEALQRLETERLKRQSDGDEPAWLSWADTEQVELGDEPVAAESQGQEPQKASAAANAPRVLARYDVPGRPAFLLARKMGRGEVLFCSSGLLSSWNTLPKTNAMLIFDRILRGMIQNTLPRRNLAAVDQFTLPLPAHEQNLLVTLLRPGQNSAEPVDVSYLGAEQRGVALAGLLTRGTYRVRGYRPLVTDLATASETASWDVPLAVNGPSEESDLTPLAWRAFEELAGPANMSLVAAGGEIDLTGSGASGQHSWWWLVLVVLAVLLVEMLVVVWPALRSPIVPLAGT